MMYLNKYVYDIILLQREIWNFGLDWKMIEVLASGEDWMGFGGEWV